MKHAFCFLLAGGLSIVSTSVWAQIGLSEAATAEQRLMEDTGFDLKRIPGANISELQNLSEIIQRGNDNIAVSDQRNPGNAINQAYIMQIGDENEALLKQTGSGNTTSVRQNGDYNKIVSNVFGNDNITKLTQKGDDNEFIRDVITSGVEFTLIQDGNQNRMKQSGLETLAPPRYEVEMLGNGIDIIIEHGRVGQ